MIEGIVDLIPPIVTLILGYLAGYLVYHHVKQAYTELVDLLVTIRNAWDDDTVSAEEFDAIMNEAREFVAAVKKKDGAQ